MLASGLTAEQVLLAVKAMSSIKSADAVRKARSRAGLSRTVTDKPDIPDPPTPLSHPDKEKSPRPPKEINPTLTPHPFERFWAAYPNKVGKADASKAFDRAIKRTSMDVLMAGLGIYAAKSDDRPWCNPATWLNQDRWADQPVAVARGSPQSRPNPLSDAFGQMALYGETHDTPDAISNPVRYLPPAGR